jgi:hypothetical protein
MCAPHTSRCRWDPRQVELAELVAVLGLRALAFKHLNRHCRLVVAVRGERLRLLGRDGGPALDQRRHDATRRLQTEREGRDVNEQDLVEVFVGLATRRVENGSLHRGTVRHGLVGVDSHVQLLAVEKILQKL